MATLRYAVLAGGWCNCRPFPKAVSHPGLSSRPDSGIAAGRPPTKTRLSMPRRLSEAVAYFLWIANNGGAHAERSGSGVDFPHHAVTIEAQLFERLPYLGKKAESPMSVMRAVDAAHSVTQWPPASSSGSETFINTP